MPCAATPPLGLSHEQPRPRRRTVPIRHTRQEIDRLVGTMPGDGEVAPQEPIQRVRFSQSAELLDRSIHRVESPMSEIRFGPPPDLVRIGRPGPHGPQANIADRQGNRAEHESPDPDASLRTPASRSRRRDLLGPVSTRRRRAPNLGICPVQDLLLML
jgi:hypothetical protein